MREVRAFNSISRSLTEENLVTMYSHMETEHTQFKKPYAPSTVKLFRRSFNVLVDTFIERRPLKQGQDPAARSRLVLALKAKNRELCASCVRKLEQEGDGGETLANLVKRKKNPKQLVDMQAHNRKYQKKILVI